MNEFLPPVPTGATPQAPHFCEIPPELEIDAACPTCGAVPPVWSVGQPLGETPGTADGGPPQKSGVQMRCRRCGCEIAYRLQDKEPSPT